MIKKLKRKFILMTMTIILVVFVILLGILNIFTYQAGKMQSKTFMSTLADHDGASIMGGNRAFPFNNPTSPPPTVANNFTVKINKSNFIFEIISTTNMKKSDTDLEHLVTSVLEKKHNFGKIGSLRYYKQERPYGQIIVFMDNSLETSLSQRLFILSTIIGGISMVVLYFVSLFLSGFVVKPVEESFNKQKQFISDASHELKTPLSVISVNSDVLENEIGSNKWLSYIISETHRMRGLVDQLLSIARMDDANRTLNITTFNLTEALYQILLPFESTAFEEHKQYSYDIEENLQYTGEKDSIQQMAVILIDNAIKHANENGEIRVSLTRNSSKFIIEVFNTGNGIDPSEKEKIFERFYCSDASRSRKNGGYGLGLSIALSIVEAHHGKISVQSEFGAWAKFTVTL